MRQGGRELERRVISLVEKVIEGALAVSLLDHGRKPNAILESAGYVRELSTILGGILGDRQDLLESAVRQIIRERLPEQRLLSGFGSFADDLEAIIGEGLKALDEDSNGELPGENIESSLTESMEEPVGEIARPAPVALGPPVLIRQLGGKLPNAGAVSWPSDGTGEAEEQVPVALRRLYPGEAIIRDYLVGRERVNFFLPRLNLVLVIGPVAELSRKKRACQRAGLRLLVLNPEDTRSPGRLGRAIRLAQME